MKYKAANECHLRSLADAARHAGESWDVTNVEAGATPGQTYTSLEHWLPFDRAMSDLRIALRLVEHEE